MKSNNMKINKMNAEYQTNSKLKSKLSSLAGLSGLMMLSLLTMAGVSPAQAQDGTGYLYITDTANKTLDRYSYNYKSGTILGGFKAAGSAANAGTANAAVLVSGVSGGFQGTANDMIVAEGDGSTIGRYAQDGTKIGTIVVTGFPDDSQKFKTITNFTISSDGKYIYAPDQGSGYVYKINLATGHIDNSVQLENVHDIVVGKDGTVFATCTGDTQKIVSYDANLKNANVLLNAGNGGKLNNPSGLTLTTDASGNTTGFYVNSQTNGANPQSSLLCYKLAGTGNNLKATLDTTKGSNSPLLQFSNGGTLGLDGNLYFSEYANLPNYVDGIYQLNTTTGAVTLVLSGQGVDSKGNPTGTGGLGGLQTPGSLHFDTDFAKGDDAGYSGSGSGGHGNGTGTAVPEPSMGMMLMGMGIAGGGVLYRRRRRA